MRKLNKFICCLILPIMAMICFTGCGGDRSTDDIKNKFSAIKAAYKIEQENESFINELFEEDSNLLDITYLGDEMKRIDDLNYSDFVTDVNLYKRYYALTELQHKVLNNALLYYVGMSDNFFENVDVKGVEKEELKTLYNKLETFGTNLETFKVAKDKLEETVDVLTFTGVVRADLTSYSFSLNTLIEQTFDFVGYFKELNTKYYFSDDVTDDNKAAFVKHYLYEACYELNQIQYYRYLKAFNNVNECDLSALVVVDGDVGKFQDKAVIDSIGEVISKSKTFTELKSSCDVETIEDFEEVRASFLQKAEIYKIVYGNMNYHVYNEYLMQGEEKLQEYKDTLTDIELANISLVENFYKTTLTNYIDECKALNA